MKKSRILLFPIILLVVGTSVVKSQASTDDRVKILNVLIAKAEPDWSVIDDYGGVESVAAEMNVEVHKIARGARLLLVDMVMGTRMCGSAGCNTFVLIERGNNVTYLFADYTLRVARSRSKGIPDIRTDRSLVFGDRKVTYRWNGARYRPYCGKRLCK